MSSLSNIVFVTGANHGIGYEHVKALLQSKKPHHVLLGSRDEAKGQSAITKLLEACQGSRNTVEPVQLDLTSDESIERAFDIVKTKYGRLDVLVNNAGAAFDNDFLQGRISLRDCFNKAYDVNVAGTQVLTHTFIPLLLKSDDARLIFVTGLSDITGASVNYYPTPPQPAGWPKSINFETIGYRATKCALNMTMVDWNHKLKEDPIKLWAVSPGFLRTGLGRPSKEMKDRLQPGDPSTGGQLLRAVVEGERDADAGKHIDRNGIRGW